MSTDLLNPGEVMTIGLTVADANEGVIKVIARGELLEVKEIGDRATTAELLEALLPHVPYGGLWLDMYRFFRPRRQ
jgi:hypothetical protein